MEQFNIGLYFTFFSLSLKVMLGVVTFSMVVSLYLKIRIIYENKGAQLWAKWYSRWVAAFLILVFAVNITFVSVMVHNWQAYYEDYIEGYKVLLYTE